MNNHNASVFKIDDNVILDHAYYIGLYLAVVGRRDLSLVEHEFFNTSHVPGMFNNEAEQSGVSGSRYAYWDDF